MKHKNVRIVYEMKQPYGIRDTRGGLLIFPHITRYPDQEKRYKRELSEQEELAAYLVKCLKEREV